MREASAGATGDPARTLLLALLAVTAIGCQPAVPGPGSNLGIPPLEVPLGRPPRSVVFTEIAIPLDEVSRAIEGAIPADLGGRSQLGLGALGNLAVRWNVRRGPARLVAKQGQLQLSLTLAGDVVVELWPLRCTSPGLGVTVEVTATPFLEGGGDLVVRSPQARRSWSGQVRCAGQRVPLERGLDALLAPVLSGIQRSLAAVRLPLGPLLGSGMALLAEPHPLTVEGRPMCLDLAPGALVLAPLAGEGGRPVARLGVEVAPRLELASCDRLRARRGHSRGKTGAAGGGLTVRELELGPSFRAQLAVALPYSELSALLRTAAVGQSWGPPGQQLRIHGIDVGDAGGRVRVSLQVTGALDGTLHLWGTPTASWEASGPTAPAGPRLILTVPDLKAALATESLLQKLRMGALALTGSSLADKLRGALRIDVTDRFLAVKKAIDGRFQLPAGAWHLDLATTLIGQPPPVVRSQPDELLVVTTLGGQAQLGPPGSARQPRAMRLQGGQVVLSDPGARSSNQPEAHR
jgi:hypothetical protein